MQFRNVCNLLTVGFFVVGGASAARAEIIVTDWFLLTQAWDGPHSSEVFEGTVSLPYSAVHTASGGAAVAQSMYDFGTEEHSAHFDLPFAYTRGGAEHSVAESLGFTRFTSDEPLEYSISGTLTLLGTGRIGLSASLIDLSVYPEVTLYSGAHGSEHTPNENLTLGVPGGDIFSGESGALSGSVIAGRLYQLNYYYGIGNYPYDPGTMATAEGTLSFTLVPEPASVFLLALGGMMFPRRGRRSL